MPETRGSQTRFTLAEDDLEFVRYGSVKGEIIVRDKTKGTLFLLTENDDYSGAVSVWNGKGYEFVRRLDWKV
jgi:hypothetical protein